MESMAITEAFGEFRTGKTQLSHTLCGKHHMLSLIHENKGLKFLKYIFLTQIMKSQQNI